MIHKNKTWLPNERTITPNANKVYANIPSHNHSQTELQNHCTNPPSPCPGHHKRPLFTPPNSPPHSNPPLLHFVYKNSLRFYYCLLHQYFQSHSKSFTFQLQCHYPGTYPPPLPTHCLDFFCPNAPEIGLARFPHIPFCS